MILISVFDACVVLVSLCGICGLCQRISNAFEEINDVIVQSDWYLYPIEINRMLPTILIVTQHPVGLKCFGSIACNRETFKEVRSFVNLKSQRNSTASLVIIK